MLSMEKALPGQVGTSSGEEPWQLPPGPMSSLLPTTALRWYPGSFASSSKTAAGLWQEKGATVRIRFPKMGKPVFSSHFQLTNALGSH